MSESVLKAACGACRTTFAVARLPMTITKMVDAIDAASCPSCGSRHLFLDASKGAPDVPLPPSDGPDGAFPR